MASVGVLTLSPTVPNLFPLLLPNQNCLRRRDAGLLNQLQELDKQISDLRLDVGKTSEEQLDTDSRPSSGEPSGASGNRPSKWAMELVSSVRTFEEQPAIQLLEREINSVYNIFNNDIELPNVP